jgi:hypothetical protein
MALYGSMPKLMTTNLETQSPPPPQQQQPLKGEGEGNQKHSSIQPSSTIVGRAITKRKEKKNVCI